MTEFLQLCVIIFILPIGYSLMQLPYLCAVCVERTKRLLGVSEKEQMTNNKVSGEIKTNVDHQSCEEKFHQLEKDIQFLKEALAIKEKPSELTFKPDDRR